MPDMTRNLNGKVPWSAMVYYDEGRCGYVGMSSSSDTVEQAHADARAWLSDHSDGPNDWYLKPSCRIRVGYRNIIDGSRS